MSLNGILIYCLRAAAFAAAACGIYALLCLLRRRPLKAGKLLALAYLSALVQITVLRGGVDWQKVFAGGRSDMQLVPLKTTLGELRLGLWPFIYHVIGNMIWFMPLGFLLRREKWHRAMIVGAAVSAGIELMQYALMTGMTDIDDLILNILGTVFAWGMGKIFRKKRT